MKFKNPLNLSLGRLLYSKRFTVPFSIIFAFVFWLVITIVQNPIRDKTFANINVTVPISNNEFLINEGLQIVSDFSNQTFTVEVNGPNYIVSSLTSNDFLLVASLDEVTSAGTYNLKINGVTNSSKSGYNFKSVTPATVEVTFDNIDTKKFSLTPQVTGVTVPTGYVGGTPTLFNSEHSQIEITGPRTIINQIKTVAAVYDGTADKDIEKTALYKTDIVLYNENSEVIYRYANDGKIYDVAGNAVSNNYMTLSVKPSDVSINYPVYKEVEVPLSPVFSNLPAGITKENIVFKTNPEKISIYSANPPAEITLSAIDWQKVTRYNNIFKVKYELPDGVNTNQEIGQITVTIDYRASKENIDNAAK